VGLTAFPAGCAVGDGLVDVISCSDEHIRTELRDGTVRVRLRRVVVGVATNRLRQEIVERVDRRISRPLRTVDDLFQDRLRSRVLALRKRNCRRREPDGCRRQAGDGPLCRQSEKLRHALCVRLWGSGECDIGVDASQHLWRLLRGRRNGHHARTDKRGSSRDGVVDTSTHGSPQIWFGFNPTWCESLKRESIQNKFARSILRPCTSRPYGEAAKTA
jgi:hypothetical protein